MQSEGVRGLNPASASWGGQLPPRHGLPSSLTPPWLRRWDSNPRPADYESAALPLSYPASSWNSYPHAPPRTIPQPLHTPTRRQPPHSEEGQPDGSGQTAPSEANEEHQAGGAAERSSNPSCRPPKEKGWPQGERLRPAPQEGALRELFVIQPRPPCAGVPHAARHWERAATPTGPARAPARRRPAPRHEPLPPAPRSGPSLRARPLVPRSP